MTGNSVVRNGFVETAFRDNLCVTVHYGRLSRSCDYAIHAAALAEMSLDQFRQYEHDHRPLVRDMGLIRRDSNRPTPVPQRVEAGACFLAFETHGNLVHN